jgi:hypothetical protein
MDIKAATQGQTTFALVVPAWLHGLEWIDDCHVGAGSLGGVTRSRAACAGSHGE